MKRIVRMYSILLLKFLFFAIRIATCHSAGNVHTITVALSEQKPFVSFDENGSPYGLDVSIIENFVKKLNLQANYVVINTSLNYIFSNEKTFNSYLVGSSLKYENYLSINLKFINRNSVQGRGYRHRCN